MRWLLVAGVAGPMLAAAAMGPDLWFKLTFIAGALCVLLLAFVPEREIAVVEDEEEMPPFMTTEQVLAFTERREARRGAKAAPQIGSVK